MSQRVPLVNTAALSEFGDLTDSAQFFDPDAQSQDLSYVPGFAEMRRTVAIQMAEVARGLRSPKDITPLPVNLRWARASTVEGKPDSTKIFGHGRKGYRLATKEDVGQKWLEKMPPGTQLGADGSIRAGDVVLMVCDADQARKNEFAKREETRRRIHGAENAFQQLVAQAGGVSKGAGPSTQKLTVEKTAQRS